jgi:uncharacterized membrane protein YbaN (DUF454 family)
MVKKYLWMGAGFVLLVIAYLGVILPGIPFSIPLVGAAYCFSKSSERMHNWLYNHPLFGEFLTNFAEKRIFPTRAKYAMVAMMLLCLVIMWFLTGNLKAMAWAAVFMAGGAAWAWRLPGSEAEWERRQLDKD